MNKFGGSGIRDETYFSGHHDENKSIFPIVSSLSKPLPVSDINAESSHKKSVHFALLLTGESSFGGSDRLEPTNPRAKHNISTYQAKTAMLPQLFVVVYFHTESIISFVPLRYSHLQSRMHAVYTQYSFHIS